MRLDNHEYHDEAGLHAFCSERGIGDDPRLLIQVFCGNLERGFIEQLNKLLGRLFPSAVIIGTTTGGEIADGRLHDEGVIVSFLRFERTRLKACFQPWDSDDSMALGKALVAPLAEEDEVPRLVIAVATGLNTNGEDFVDGIGEALPGVPLAGGLAGEYLRFRHTWIFNGREVITRGAIAVALYNPALRIQTLYSMDWMPLGRALRVDRARKNLLIRLDGRPALETYRYYLGDEAARQLPVLSVQFPLMVERQGLKLARACVGANDDGSMVFMGNFRSGEHAWFAIGDPQALLDSSSEVMQHLRQARYEAILTYTCVARKALMTRLIEDEARVFNELAPTAGFFTYGEFFHLQAGNLFFNYTLTLVAMSESADEGQPLQGPPISLSDARISTEARAYAHLINTTARELESLIERMRQQALTDELTGLPNRRHLMDRLRELIGLHERNQGDLSVLLLDLDGFKQVNDHWGHQVGDEVLRELARVLEEVVRLSDVPGRWGGEEFLVLCPDTAAAGAHELAERLRRRIEQHAFPEGLRITASIGCAHHRRGESLDRLVGRADDALYRAKAAGKNRVRGCTGAED